ncbi:hypothetical protein M569_03162 [Genlisea aurea]|uniref:At3g05675-like ankyrin-like domain-containing protein n=1 Tax=Genlisea aurea TaxID=192259 RepID=S8E6Y1_9LAMI|nr:hypothetical protein M569_03162 [Genlisea aurea]
MRDLKHGSDGGQPPMRRRRHHWCCSFTTPPLSPDCPPPPASPRVKTELPPRSPHHHQRLPLAWRILSPGRVSPISDQPVIPDEIPQNRMHPAAVPVQPEISSGEEAGKLDVRLNARGRNGESLVLMLGSRVLIENSQILADLVANAVRCSSSGVCRIEVPQVENLNMFRETIQLMFEDDIEKKLRNMGVFRAIGILEVCMGIKFSRGISSCIKYLDAVPWSEEEEEKLRESMSRFDDGGEVTSIILDRLCSPPDETLSQRALIKDLIWSITRGRGEESNARKELLKIMVKSLVGKSSVYEKKYPDLKQDIMEASISCLSSLRDLLLLKAKGGGGGQSSSGKPLLELVSKHVDDAIWLFEVLLDQQAGEEFVALWGNQDELMRMHGNLSPMVRYELSRVTASLVVAMGTRKLHCPCEWRARLLRTWFQAMMEDFGWLQRCRKGLDMKAVEECVGQVVLTLPLKDQYGFFMGWFASFSRNPGDCPNLSKAFQVWWRRSSNHPP